MVYNESIPRFWEAAMGNTLSKNRIWEIDFLRGLLIPGMIMIHLIYDVVDLYGFIHWPYPEWYSLFKNNYGALFVALSGLSVTLGRKSIRRGIQVVLSGMCCTVVTVGMYFIGMADRGIIIYFGVLHCLGSCMILWPCFRNWKSWAMAGFGVLLVAAGWVLRTHVHINMPVLLLLGFQFYGFASSDYFPLMPNLGYFLLGAALGRTLYAEKRSLWPHGPAQNPVVRFFSLCGRHSLGIYLAHQPVLAALCELIVFLRKM